MGLITINLKIHQPGKAKRDIIETAFLNYNNAFTYLLQKASMEIDKIGEAYKSPKGNYSTLALSKWIDRELSNELNQFDVQPFKDSIKLDFGMTLASYFVHKKSKPWLPFSVQSNGPRPIYFCRYDTKRSFCLLYDAQNNKFFAKLFLMNLKNAKPRSNTEVKRELVCISKNKEIARCFKRETFVILPLSFGRWQENMLKIAVEQPEIFRTARLLKKKEDYYLSLSINLPEAEPVPVNSYLGVSRGIENPLNFSVVDFGGNLLQSGEIESQNIKNIANLKNEICIIANRIVDLALQNKSMVILQNLVGKGDKLSWTADRSTDKPEIGCKLYNELTRVLEYKLTQQGLPPPAKVSSVDIFSRCCICRSNSRKNRFSKTMFICTTCGASYRLDLLGSINLAEKLIQYESTPLKLKVKKTQDGMYLQNNLIGLDLFITKNEDPYHRMREEINGILAKTNSNSKETNMIIERMIKQDFANIEIIN